MTDPREYDAHPMISTERDLPEDRLAVFAANLDASDWTSALLAAYNPTGASEVRYETAKAALVADLDALASIRAERDMAERAAVEAAIPLEALLMAGQGPLSDAVWDGVRNGVGHVRSMLKARAARAIAGEQTNG